MGAVGGMVCRPVETSLRYHPSRKVLVSTLRSMVGIKKPKYYYRVDEEGRVYIYVHDAASPRRRVLRLVLRPVEQMHRDTMLVDRYWSLVSAILCEEEGEEDG